MAVTISSDLVLDVMRNADPARKAEAISRLQSFGGVFSNGRDFAGLLQCMDQPAGVGTSGGSAMHQRAESTNSLAAYAGFERMVLRNLFESLLPAVDSGAYGAGPSAGVWRSMAAEQFATTYAEAGGLGIADALSRERIGTEMAQVEQWPYFKLDAISSFAG
ncbi:rod-binding protein [Aestuariivirga sp.]|uniref:rod-binding protein n=1 Tax=Aestuariivirga sp. TaxID=2650926 RepID=UPI00391CD585